MSARLRSVTPESAWRSNDRILEVAEEVDDLAAVSVFMPAWYVTPAIACFA
jgi:hypothetical protein